MDPVDPDSDSDPQHWLQWAATRAAIVGQRSRMMTCPRRICCKALCFIFFIFPVQFFLPNWKFKSRRPIVHGVDMSSCTE
jgi:hypothetical protein